MCVCVCECEFMYMSLYIYIHFVTDYGYVILLVTLVSRLTKAYPRH